MLTDLNLFKALGEETKNRILKVVLEGEICACNIPAAVSRSQPNTSMHLAKLVQWGLIKSRRQGKMILYSIKDPRVASILKLVRKRAGR